MKNTLTIFTPTFNRCKTLNRLYESLCKQTCREFIWLIIGDGSCDDTRKNVEKWILNDYIKIRYLYQKNSGKAMAHNRALEYVDTDLFVCVDSDDFLANNAVDTILNKDMQENIGILFKRIHVDGRLITLIKHYPNNSTLLDAYRVYGMSGDTMLVYKTSIIKKYRFPYFKGEKFVPEAYLYDLLDREGTLLFCDESLYICEYLSDGYTRHIKEIIAKNPRGYNAFISQRLSFDKNVRDYFFDAARYVAISIVLRKKNIIKNSPKHFYTSVCFVLGILSIFERLLQVLVINNL